VFEVLLRSLPGFVRAHICAYMSGFRIEDTTRVSRNQLNLFRPRPTISFFACRGSQ
jgi:hypothetical protein